MHEQMTCSKCGKSADGYKCEVCGAEAGEHDASHACGGDRCVIKCSGCNEAHTKCTCSVEPDDSPDA